jgi:excisionase family DNA binding protein
MPLFTSKRMLSMRAAADYTGTPYSTWTKLYQVWEVPHYRTGRRVWFREGELEGWLQDHGRG